MKIVPVTLSSMGCDVCNLSTGFTGKKVYIIRADNLFRQFQVCEDCKETFLTKVKEAFHDATKIPN